MVLIVGGDGEHKPWRISRDHIITAYRAGLDAVISLIEYEQDLIAAQRARIESLEARMAELERRLHADSHNSSKPPSSDGMGRKVVQTRKPTGRKPGGQKGHEGTTLRLSEHPDHVVVHAVKACMGCGKHLGEEALVGYDRRQEVDLPAMRAEVTEHRAEIKLCGDCGQESRGELPERLKGVVQYGPRIRASLVYLKDYALVPFERGAELMQDLFGIRVSAGTIANIDQECSRKLDGTVELIREQIRGSEVANFDETGLRIEGKLWWLHSAGTPSATLYLPHGRRGTEAMEAVGILPDYQGVAVHDFWSSYLSYPCTHALCNAQLLRELTFIWEEWGQKWAQQMGEALRGWKKVVERAKDRGLRGLCGRMLGRIEGQYDQIVRTGLRANPLAAPTGPPRRGRRKKSKAGNLVERLRDHRQEVLRFLFDFRVPFDNNGAQRDLRMMKVQQKISGTFRSYAGAVAFCRIRSYVATCRKLGLNVIEALTSVFLGEPQLDRLLAKG
jgi:transposase